MKIQHFIALVVLSLTTVPGARAAVPDPTAPAVGVVETPNCVAVPSGLVAWWRAEGDADDATGVHNGQLLFGTAFAQGRAGQAFSFAGARSRVNIPDSDAFKLTNSLTFEGWIQAASWAPGIIFIRGDNRGGLDPYHMALSSSGHLHWGIDAADNSSATVSDPNTLPIGVWTHVAGVFNGTNGDLDLYVNGSLVSHTTTQLRPLRELDPNSEPAVGIGNAGGTVHQFPYHGLIDEWSLYGRALSGQEILGIYQAGALGKCTINLPPRVTTLAADQLTTTSARLRGQVNPHGSPTTAWFEWGTDTNYGNQIGMQDVGQGSSVSNSAVLNGLVIGTDYHFRAVASNALGLVAGLDQTFNLNTQRPAVTTLAADQLTTTSARLRGQVDPRGSPTTAWFEWGTDTNYGNLIGMQDVGQGSSVSDLNVVLDGLTSGLAYHYRLVATNAFGAAYGANQTFDTTPQTHTWTGAEPSGYWSAPANWSPVGVPPNGAQLVFPDGLPPGDMVSTNDLTDRIFHSIRLQAGGHTIRGNPITLTSRSDCIINGGTNVIACDLTFSGTPSTPNYQFSSIRGLFGFNGSPAELTVIGNVGGGSLYVINTRLVIMGQFTGGSLRVQYGSLALIGDNPHAVSVEIYAPRVSTNRFQGSQPNLNITTLREMESAQCPSVSGDGLVGDVMGCGSITPNPTLSAKNVSGRLDIYLNGPNAGEYGRLIASGNVSLESGRLFPSAGFNPRAGQIYTIIEKTSPGPVNAFLGPEGTITTLNGRPFRISYVGGDGNDVTLTAQAIPGDPTFSDENWSPLGSGLGNSPGWYSVAHALAVSGSSLYAGGFFHTAGGSPAGNIAKWDGSSWSALGSGVEFGFDLEGATTSVNALAQSGNDLYVGGLFKWADGNPATNIARWNGTSWSPLGLGVSGSRYATVLALAVSGSDLYAGGSFTMAGGSSANRIAKWNGNTWSALGSGMNLPLRALAVSGNDLYAGGDFTTAGGTPASRIAIWNGSSWSPLGSGMNSTVHALVVSGSDVYAGGSFTTAGGTPASRIAKWNGSSWSPLGSGMNGTVHALAVSGSDLYAGGSFTTAGGSPATNIAKWNGTTWSALGSGLSGGSNPFPAVYALAVSGSDLYVGGGFTTAGGSPASRIAKARIASAAESITASGSSAAIQFSGVVGYQYHVQRTASLTPPVTWTTLTTAPLSLAGDGSFSFVDTNRPPGTAYYRLVQH